MEKEIIFRVVITPTDNDLETKERITALMTELVENLLDETPDIEGVLITEESE
jgi:hypothetical protein